jgi:hypothetical protein
VEIVGKELKELVLQDREILLDLLVHHVVAVAVELVELVELERKQVMVV